MTLYYSLIQCTIITVLCYLKHFKMAEKVIIVSEVIPRHDETLAWLPPDVAQPVVAEVCHPGPRGEVDTAVRPEPSLGTEADSCQWEEYYHLTAGLRAQTNLRYIGRDRCNH